MVFKASLYDIEKAIEVKDLKELPLEEVFPEQYRKFLLFFNKVLADRLTLHLHASAKCILVTGSLQECLRGGGV